MSRKTPLHFIDLILTSNRNTILLRGVDEPFLEQNIRYPCPVFCVLTFSKPSAPLYKHRVFIYDRGNYQAFSNDLVQTDWQTLKSENVNTYTENITERIITLASKHVPSRLINARKTDPSWLTTHVKKLIRKKRLFDKYKKSNNINYFETHKQFKNLVTSEILTEHLASPYTKQNNWWKTFKHFIKPEQADGIPPLNKNGHINTEEKDKANILNTFFTEQNLLDESQATLPQTVTNTTHKLDSIIAIPEEVRDTLKSLPIGKAAGPDLIDNQLRKELAQPLALPLSYLF